MPTPTSGNGPSQTGEIGLVGKRSIKHKLILMIMVVSSVALLFASVAFITFQWFSFRQRMVSDLSTLADMLADNVTAAITFNDFKDAEDVLNSLRAKPSIVLARIDLENGPVFAQYKNDRNVSVFDEKLSRKNSYRFVKDRLVMSRQIKLKDQRLGTLYLQSDLRELSVFIDKSIITLVFLILLTSIAAFLLASRLQRVISGPLFHLADVSRVVSRDENYSIRAVKTSDDEIGILTESFNNMLSQIERRELDRKRDEEELRRLRNLLSNIINSMPSILVGVDTQGRVTHWNLQAEKLTGIEAVNARGSLLKEVFPQLSGEMGKVMQAIRELKPQKDEKIPGWVNGEIHYSDVTVYPLVTTEVEGAVIRVDDVTERVRMEEMMIQSEKMLSVGGLAAGMAHEINNPLAGILQNIQVIKNRIGRGLPKNDQAATDCGITMEALEAYLERRNIFTIIDAIMEAGRRASKIVDNMLSFSRKGRTSFSQYSLVQLLEQTIELASNDYDLKKKYDFRQIAIRREFQPTMPEVYCETSMIQQVFFNIFKNGAQAMADNKDGEKKPCFILRAMTEDHMARIEIEDNGPGLDETIRKRVFEPFFTTKGVGTGTGLGLSVSYFIITESHGGTMSVESTPGKGTRFIIRLPIKGSMLCPSGH